MHKGIDTCAPVSATSARTLKAEGYSFIGRYLVPETGSTKGKALTRAEAERICAAGLRILCCWETTADRVKGGAEAGNKDGARAYALARKLQIPAGAIIYFAVDYNAGESDYRRIAAYLTAAQAQIKPEYVVGVYGSARVCDAVKALMPTCKGFWQCCAWSFGVSSATTVYQSHGQDSLEAKAEAAKIGFAVDLDICEDMRAAGIWNYNREDNMTDKELYEAVQRHAAAQPLPKWAMDELQEAQEMGITDGTRPMELIPRYQAAIMAKRAVRAALREQTEEDNKRYSGLLADD